MNQDNLLQAAKDAGQRRARPLASNFKVGAAFEFSNGEVLSGGNTEDRGKTVVGACAERNVLAAANNQLGPLSEYGRGGVVGWSQAAVWANTPGPITPCGICRDFMAATAQAPESSVLSQCEGPTRSIFTIGELLPLAGRGPGGDVKEEIEVWRLNGGRITQLPSSDSNYLIGRAMGAAERSYRPPFSSEPLSGAMLLTEDNKEYEGFLVVDATTRLGGTAISMAVRNALVGPIERTSRVVAVGLYTKGDVLRAPTGCDLQLLQEIRAKHGDVDVLFGCDKSAYKTSLDALLPNPFGRNDLGY
jgi:cytidine deaminase